MTDRYNAFVVILDKDIREDDALEEHKRRIAEMAENPDVMGHGVLHGVLFSTSGVVGDDDYNVWPPPGAVLVSGPYAPWAPPGWKP